MRPRGGAQRWFLHHALASLAESLRAKGSDLIILRGASRILVPAIAEAIGAGLVTWNRRYGGAERELDGAIKATLKEKGVTAESFNGHLLYEPMEIRSQAGGPLRVFTPFWRACRAKRPVDAPLPPPDTLPPPLPALPDLPSRVALDGLALLPTKPDWAGGLRETWEPGEAGARKRLPRLSQGRVQWLCEDRKPPGPALHLHALGASGDG